MVSSASCAEGLEQNVRREEGSLMSGSYEDGIFLDGTIFGASIQKSLPSFVRISEVWKVVDE